MLNIFHESSIEPKHFRVCETTKHALGVKLKTAARC